MCDCIEQIRKDLKKSDPESHIVETQFYMNKNANVGDDNIFEERMCAHYTSRKKLKDGSFTNRTARQLLSFNFCPFCGEKYV